MKLHTYLSFNGNCAQAFNFYAELFGGKIHALMTFGDSPMAAQCGADAKALIMHGCVEVLGHQLMGTDATPDHPYQGVTGHHIVVDVGSDDEAQRIFDALAAGGRIDMPLAETFWARRYGMLVDRFGIAWMVNYSTQEVGPGCG
jgi:PhnB protein